MDFNASEADQIVGSCKEQSNEIIAISDNNNNINPPNKSGFESSQLPSPTSETPSPLPLIVNDTLPNFEPTFQFNPNDVNQVDFQSLPSLSIPLNDIDMQELQFN